MQVQFFDYDRKVQSPQYRRTSEQVTMSETVSYSVIEASPRLSGTLLTRSSGPWTERFTFDPDLQVANTISNIVEFEAGKSAIKLKQEIKNLIGKFEGQESVFAPNFVSQEVARNAKKFIDLIPLNRKLPKVDADGEGAMMFLWAETSKRVLVVVEADRLHIAFNAASPNSEYSADIPFNGTSLPEQLVTNLPL